MRSFFYTSCTTAEAQERLYFECVCLCVRKRECERMCEMWNVYGNECFTCVAYLCALKKKKNSTVCLKVQSGILVEV